MCHMERLSMRTTGLWGTTVQGLEVGAHQSLDASYHSVHQLSMADGRTGTNATQTHFLQPTPACPRRSCRLQLHSLWRIPSLAIDFNQLVKEGGQGWQRESLRFFHKWCWVFHSFNSQEVNGEKNEKQKKGRSSQDRVSERDSANEVYWPRLHLKPNFSYSACTNHTAADWRTK